MFLHGFSQNVYKNQSYSNAKIISWRKHCALQRGDWCYWCPYIKLKWSVFKYTNNFSDFWLKTASKAMFLFLSSWIMCHFPSTSQLFTTVIYSHMPCEFPLFLLKITLVESLNKQHYFFFLSLLSCCAPQFRKLCLRRRSEWGLSPRKCVRWRKPMATWRKRWRPWNVSCVWPNEKPRRSSKLSALNSSRSHRWPKLTLTRTLPKIKRTKNLKKSHPRS